MSKRAARRGAMNAREHGFTLIETLLATAVLGMVSGALAGAIYGITRAYAVQREEAAVVRAANATLARIDRYGRGASAVLWPALGDSSADSLVFAAGLDEDGDVRVNEDPPGDLGNDARPGIMGFDDDGDGLTDEDAVGRQPGAPGYGTFVVDVGITALPNDDDEDGLQDEDPPNRVVFRWVSGRVEEVVDGHAETVATGPSGFMAVHRSDPGGASSVDVRLKLGTSSEPDKVFTRQTAPVNDGHDLGAMASF